MKKLLLGTAFATVAAAGGAMADGHSTTVCLITKTDTNPFFVKMKEGAEAKAEELGMTQPSTSGQIGKLREALNDPLFVRESHGMAPTPLPR